MAIALAAAGSARWAQVTVILLAHHAATQAAGPTEWDWIRWTGDLLPPWEHSSLHHLVSHVFFAQLPGHLS